MAPEIPVFDVEQVAAVLHVGRPLALQLEHEKPAVVAGGDEVDLGVRCEDAEAVFTSAGEEVCTLGGIPYADGLVLAVAVEGFRIERL